MVITLSRSLLSVITVVVSLNYCVLAQNLPDASRFHPEDPYGECIGNMKIRSTRSAPPSMIELADQTLREAKESKTDKATKLNSSEKLYRAVLATKPPERDQRECWEALSQIYDLRNMPDIADKCLVNMISILRQSARQDPVYLVTMLESLAARKSWRGKTSDAKSILLECRSILQKAGSAAKPSDFTALEASEKAVEYDFSRLLESRNKNKAIEPKIDIEIQGKLITGPEHVQPIKSAEKHRHND